MNSYMTSTIIENTVKDEKGTVGSKSLPANHNCILLLKTSLIFCLSPTCSPNVLNVCVCVCVQKRKTMFNVLAFLDVTPNRCAGIRVVQCI